MSRRNRQMLALIGACSLVLVALIYVTTRPAPPPPAGAPANPDSTVVHSVSGPLNGRTEAELEVLSGAESVTIHSDNLGDVLYRASTLPGSTVVPTTTDSGARVTLGLTNTAIAGQAAVHVYLNANVRWKLTLAGGGLEQAVDFGSGHLSGVEVRAGAGRVDLALPKPSGVLPVKLAGGAGALAIHAATGVPAQVSLAADGNVGTLTVDGKVQRGLPGGTVVTPDGWAGAADRYDIQAGGGFATVSLDRGIGGSASPQ
jgi:hypothetical protein